MNRFFRTAYSSALVYLCLALFAVLLTGVRMPFPAFSCLYFGLLLCLLPGVSRRLAGKEGLFYALGALTALLGFLPLVFWHCPLIHFAVHLLGTAAAAAFIPLLRHRTTHADFMAKYQFSAIMLLILIGFIALATMTGVYADSSSSRPEVLKLAVNSIIPHAIVLLVTGVLLLRGLRAGEGIVDEQAFNRRQLRDTLIFAVIVTLVFAADPFVYLQQAAHFLINDVLKPAGRGLTALLAAIVRLLHVDRPEWERETQPTEETAEPGGIPNAESPEPAQEHYDIEGEDLSQVIAYIFIGIAVLILLWVLVRQIRKLIRKLRERGQKYGSGYPDEVRETLPQKERAQSEKKPKRRSADPRERMRYLYGEFLQYLRKLRVTFAGTETCGEIQNHTEKSAAAGPAELSAFTELYEEARYRQEEAPSEEDERRMKDLFDKIKKKI